MEKRSKFETVPGRPLESTFPSPHVRFAELQGAWRLLRAASDRFDRIADAEGWPTPFGAVPCLVLCHLARATAYGLSARRLGDLLSMPPSSLAYHLDALERARLVTRSPWTIHDRRKVAVRITQAGRYAVLRLVGEELPGDREPVEREERLDLVDGGEVRADDV
jgi:DNA-binding MarR family transcriptional regulator